MTEIVFDRAGFHVSRLLPYNSYKPISSGDILTIGARANPFFDFYERSRAYPVETPSGQIFVPAIKFLKSVQSGQIESPTFPQISVEVAEHYVILARELILEETRLELASSAPSRRNCMWLSDTLEEAQTWKARLGSGTIFQLELTGKIHRADASHLLGDSEPLSETYERARAYWRGTLSEKPEIETLFCGSAKVVAAV